MPTNPITPPPELVEQWLKWLNSEEGQTCDDWVAWVAVEAAQWGADQELEACCALMDDWGLDETDLRFARRPKPPSLKEQALTDLYAIYTSQPFHAGDSRFNCIRRALEALPE